MWLYSTLTKPKSLDLSDESSLFTHIHCSCYDLVTCVYLNVELKDLLHKYLIHMEVSFQLA